MRRKKNLKQRREILLKAWPNMSATHRPDFVNFRDSKKQAPRSRTCRSEAFLWPHINLEDLQQRNLLLLFLNSRGRNLPETFRLADVKAAHLGQGWMPDLDFSDIAYWNEHDKETFLSTHGLERQFMLFHKKSSPTGYGRVIDRTTWKLSVGQLKHLSRSSEVHTQGRDLSFT